MTDATVRPANIRPNSTAIGSPIEPFAGSDGGGYRQPSLRASRFESPQLHQEVGANRAARRLPIRLQPTVPHLTRSSLHRCLQRHEISQLPQVEGEASAKRKFKAYPIGYFHIDIAEVRTAQGKLYLLVAIDRTSKFAFVELHEKVARRTAGDFLRRLIAAVPYKVHTVLTDNGTHFTTPGNTSSAAPDIKAALEAGELVWAHAFEYACAQNDIDHRLTKPKHPWTNGQVERMNRTIKDATVKRYFYETHDQLRAHLQNFVDAYNFAKRLKTLRGLTPYSSERPGLRAT